MAKKLIFFELNATVQVIKNHILKWTKARLKTLNRTNLKVPLKYYPLVLGLKKKQKEGLVLYYLTPFTREQTKKSKWATFTNQLMKHR